MTRLIFWLLGCAVVLLGLLAGVLWLVSSLSRSNESYAEQQARIAREQQSADFWQWVVKVIVLLIGLALLTFIWQWAANQSHKRKLEELKTREDLFRLYPDQNGNKPTRFDRHGNTINPRPGNTPYPLPPANFVVGNSPVVKLPDAKQRPDMPLVVNTNGQKATGYSVKELEPNKLPEPNLNRVLNHEPKIEASEPIEPGSEPEPEPDYGQLLTDAKKRGESKSSAIPRITGVPRNGKEEWKAWAEFWDKIEI
jgi:hypothetical protein